MTKRLGIVSYTNVAPLHWGLLQEAQGGLPHGDASSYEYVYGVPTELNAMLLAGDIDLTLMSSVEFLRNRHTLKALPDFSISSLGEVRSVLLFHWHPWEALAGKRIALTHHSATSVALLKLLLAQDGMEVSYETVTQDVEKMLASHDAALIIGDDALREYYQQRSFGGKKPLVTDLGMQWYKRTSLPFTFAVWATRVDNPPSPAMLAHLRQSREVGIGNLAAICKQEAAKLAIPQQLMQRYLHNFRYYFEQPDRDALTTFATKLLSDFTPDSLHYWDR